MKTTITFFILLFLISTNLNAQNWTWQNPLPNSNQLYTSYFFDANTGFFGGDFGTLLKTTNGGINISVISTGNNYNVNSITFLNSATGYMACGFNEKVIMKTTNGGSNWVVTNFGAPYSLSDVKFINANSGIAISSYQTIFYTTNGGANWTGVNGAALGLYSVEYVTPTLAYIVSSGGTLQKSTNGGINWSSQVITAPGASLYDINFTDSLKGYICGSSSIVLKTTNGGVNWTNTNAPGSYSFKSISFVDSSTGGAVTDDGKFLKTTNGGTNWTISSPPPANYNGLNAIKYLPAGVIYLSGLYGNNMKSTDGGASWTSLVTGENTYIFSSYFMNVNTGFASLTGGSMLKTTNGGLNWTSQLTPAAGNNIVGVNFVDANTGYAVPIFATDEYLKTTNAGTNWFIVNPGINSAFADMKFVNANTGLLISQSNTYRTTNAGINWAFIDSVSTTLVRMDFVNSSTGYVSTYNSPNTYFRKTTNGGANWVLLPGNIQNTFISVYKFIDANTGYAAGTNMYKTTDGGISWVSGGATGVTAQSMHIFDANTILVGGVFGYLKKSTDGGTTFTNIPFISNNGITTMSFVNAMTGWLMGEGGMIIRTDDILTNSTVTETQIPKEYLLSQNYPNPFNPTTKISFEIPKSGLVSLKIYDVLGREVAAVINEYRQAGKYTLDFDAAGFSSGIYFYRLSTNGFSDIKKMLLIK
ncbi:MAG: YCF48-related protein [Ignavibacteria bacterium]|nr:YCF48-related protein [Ignavibacteria bacterium]